MADCCLGPRPLRAPRSRRPPLLPRVHSHGVAHEAAQAAAAKARESGRGGYHGGGALHTDGRTRWESEVGACCRRDAYDGSTGTGTGVARATDGTAPRAVPPAARAEPAWASSLHCECAALRNANQLFSVENKYCSLRQCETGGIKGQHQSFHLPQRATTTTPVVAWLAGLPRSHEYEYQQRQRWRGQRRGWKGKEDLSTMTADALRGAA